MKSKPAALGTIWPIGARLAVDLNDGEFPKTVDTCMDTPAAIKHAAMRLAKKYGIKLDNVWFKSFHTPWDKFNPAKFANLGLHRGYNYEPPKN